MTIAIIAFALAGNVLSIDGSFLFVFATILLMIFLLNRTLFKPINRVLDERERLGVGRLAEAQRLLADYEKRVAGYEEQLRAARAEAYQELESSRRQFLATRTVALDKIKAETAAQIAAARQEIEAQASTARENLGSDARVMAATISSQILQRPVSTGGN